MKHPVKNIKTNKYMHIFFSRVYGMPPRIPRADNQLVLPIMLSWNCKRSLEAGCRTCLASYKDLSICCTL